MNVCAQHESCAVVQRKCGVSRIACNDTDWQAQQTASEWTSSAGLLQSVASGDASSRKSRCAEESSQTDCMLTEPSTACSGLSQTLPYDFHEPFSVLSRTATGCAGQQVAESCRSQTGAEQTVLTGGCCGTVAQRSLSTVRQAATVHPARSRLSQFIGDLGANSQPQQVMLGGLEDVRVMVSDVRSHYKLLAQLVEELSASVLSVSRGCDSTEVLGGLKRVEKVLETHDERLSDLTEAVDGLKRSNQEPLDDTQSDPSTALTSALRSCVGPVVAELRQSAEDLCVELSGSMSNKTSLRLATLGDSFARVEQHVLATQNLVLRVIEQLDVCGPILRGVQMPRSTNLSCAAVIAEQLSKGTAKKTEEDPEEGVRKGVCAEAEGSCDVRTVPAVPPVVGSAPASARLAPPRRRRCRVPSTGDGRSRPWSLRLRSQDLQRGVLEDCGDLSPTIEAQERELRFWKLQKDRSTRPCALLTGRCRKLGRNGGGSPDIVCNEGDAAALRVSNGGAPDLLSPLCRPADRQSDVQVCREDFWRWKSHLSSLNASDSDFGSDADAAAAAPHMGDARSGFVFCRQVFRNRVRVRLKRRRTLQQPGSGVSAGCSAMQWDCRAHCDSLRRQRERISAPADLHNPSSARASSLHSCRTRLLVEMGASSALGGQRSGTFVLYALGVWSALLAGVVRVLLMPAYRSTDFEVHRNWLAITSSLPLRQWYWEASSPWTLDYPPFFAYFEWALASVARVFEPGMLVVDALDFASSRTVAFQRSTVVLADFVLLCATLVYIFRALPVLTPPHRRSTRALERVVVLALVVLCPGLLIVDHIHFQYNGYLSGLFVLAFALVTMGSELLGFASLGFLLLSKHLYVYFAPAFGVWAVRRYVRVPLLPWRVLGAERRGVALRRACVLGTVALSMALVAFAPFVVCGQNECGSRVDSGQASVVRLWPLPLFFDFDALAQILRRLFPVQRGLCHAYWAPNFWALYSAADKACDFAARRVSVVYAAQAAGRNAVGLGTRGLVGESAPHLFLPHVTPVFTLVLTVLSCIPMLVRLWVRPTSRLLAYVTIYTGSMFFVFGWHVHEKAILTIVVPMTLVATLDRASMRLFYILSVVATFAQFPLLFRPEEVLIKVLLLALYATISYVLLAAVWYDRCKGATKLRLLRPWERWYLYGLVPLEIAVVLSPHAIPRFPFLPLMAVSTYCAAGILYWCALLHAKCVAVFRESSPTPADETTVL